MDLKNEVKTAIILFLYLLAVSCENGIAPKPEKQQMDTLYSSTYFLWPTKVGNYWDYKGYNFMNHYNFDSNWTYEGFASFGLDLDTIKSVASLYRLEIVDSVFISIDDTLYSCHVLGGYDLITEKYNDLKFPYWIGNGGIYDMGIFVKGQDSLFNKGLYIPSEIPLNENWGGQMSYRIDGFLLQVTSVVERKCLSKNEVINTPMGTFECYVIFTRIWMADDVAGYYDYYDYYAPGIGKVCRVRLAVTPILGQERYGWWWLTNISIIENYSINSKEVKK